ncbi:MAG: radical SAM protein [Candidatus Aminicenantes bacterium]|jgi:radical SAM superfamily enzyme YgiQ (UPF0313 family)
MKMRLLFVIPRLSPGFIHQFYQLSDRWKNWRHLRRDLKKHERYARRVFYGLGILTMAAVPDPGKYEIEVVDENFQPIDFNKKYDLVCLTGLLIHNRRMLEIIEIFRQKGTYIVIGGIQATLFPEEYTKEGVSVICGEGELLFNQFLRDYVNLTPKSVYQNPGGGNGDMGRSLTPRFDLVSMYRYNLIGVQTTRGCPYNCEYCNVTNILGNQYRHKPVEQVVAEVKIVKKYWPDNMFYFYDDALFADRKYALRLFKTLKDQGIHLGKYGSHADISIYKDRELLDLLVQVGNPVLAVGFETLSPRNAMYLNNPMKTTTIPRYQKAVRQLQKSGVKLTGSFMFGFKGDRAELLDTTLDFVKKNAINAYFTIYSATPRSKLFNRLLNAYEKENGKIKPAGFEQTRIINEYHREQNGFAKDQEEEMILDRLKKYFPEELPISMLEGLVVSKAYRDPAIM